MFKTTVLTGLVAFYALPVLTQAQGYFDFGGIEGLSERPKVQIELNPAMLRFVTETVRGTDPEAAALIERIETVRVLVYGLEDRRPVFEYIEEASERLESEGWDRMVYVNDEEHDVQVRVYVTFNGTNFAGMTAMIANDKRGSDDAVFINIVGEIDPAELGRVARALGIDDVIPDVGPAGRDRDDDSEAVDDDE